jgi:hypothetical protein
MGDLLFFLFQLLLRVTYQPEKKSKDNFYVAVAVVVVLITVVALICVFNPHPQPKALLGSFKA